MRLGILPRTNLLCTAQHAGVSRTKSTAAARLPKSTLCVREREKMCLCVLVFVYVYVCKCEQKVDR